MKRILVITFVLCFVFSSIFYVKTKQSETASTEPFTSGYAQILTNDCYLYKSPEKSSGIFLLEQSYFVKVIEVTDNVFFKVQYLQFEGYVEKSKVSFIEEFPKEPYLVGITFDIYDIGNVCLRNTPETLDDDKNIICTIAASTKDLTYYGKCTGEEAIKGLGNVWYYCAYQDNQDNIFKGYIYAPLTRNLSAITSSIESLTLVSIENFRPVDNLLYLNLSTKNILIILTALPTLFVLYLFTKPSKILEDTDNKQ